MKKTFWVSNQIKKGIKKNGGFVNCHAHFDKAFIVTKNNYHFGQATMQEKWNFFKQQSYDDYYKRMEQSVLLMIDQGIKNCRTDIDVNTVVKDKPLKAILAVRKKYAKKINIFIGFQTLFGILNKKEKNLYLKYLHFADYIGGLPSADRPHFLQSVKTFIQIAKNTNKPIALHIDQEFNPDEKDTITYAKEIIKAGLINQASLVHGISIAVQSPKEKKEIYATLKYANISIIVCPSAALSMKMLPKKAFLSNSITPIKELIENGINVALGTDNIHDFFMPLAEGDLWTELKFLAESNRFYDIKQLIKIASSNGLKIILNNK